MLIDPDTSGLYQKEDGSHSGWRFWEVKQGNAFVAIERGIVDYEAPSSLAIKRIEVSIRKKVVQIYKPSWNRGFGFGAIIQFQESPTYELHEFISCVDSYSKSKGVFQWVIVVNHKNMSVYAAHMWSNGVLHENFIKTLDKLTTLRYSVEKVYKKQPNFFKNLASSSDSAANIINVLNKLSVLIAGAMLLYYAFNYLFTAF